MISIAMRLVTDSISLSTLGGADISDITPQVTARLGRHVERVEVAERILMRLWKKRTVRTVPMVDGRD